MLSANAVAMINSLTVFENLKKGEVLNGLRLLLSTDKKEDAVSRYADFVSALFKHGYDLGKYLLDAASEDYNAYSALRAKRKEIPDALQKCVDGEIEVLSELAAVTAEDLRKKIGYDGYLATFENAKIDFKAEFEKRMAEIWHTGYGMYARNVMFRLNEKGEIEPVASPDERSIDRLIGYESEREILVENTRALMDGRPAANAFLYGDAGTGKSSTVKAVVNLFAPKGLRMVEVKKNQLGLLASVMESLRDNPLKFIIFIDDVAFKSVDDDFGLLKTLLEGSASVRANNTAIYVTSNRRHLVKESFGDRDGDDVHRNDTIQELAALSARFGISILFRRPNKALYMKIATELARKNNIEIKTEELERQADAFALRKGGYTPRAAEQFIDLLKSKSEE